MLSNAISPALSARPPTACKRLMFLSLALIFVLGTAARGQAQIVTSTWLGGESTATGDWSNAVQTMRGALTERE